MELFLDKMQFVDSSMKTLKLKRLYIVVCFFAIISHFILGAILILLLYSTMVIRRMNRISVIHPLKNIKLVEEQSENRIEVGFRLTKWKS